MDLRCSLLTRQTYQDKSMSDSNERRTFDQEVASSPQASDLGTKAEQGQRVYYSTSPLLPAVRFEHPIFVFVLLRGGLVMRHDALVSC
jgi:hypothetical protein